MSYTSGICPTLSFVGLIARLVPMEYCRQPPHVQYVSLFHGTDETFFRTPSTLDSYSGVDTRCRRNPVCIRGSSSYFLAMSFEQQRLANIAKNRALLEQLGLSDGSGLPAPVAKPPPPKAKEKAKAKPRNRASAVSTSSQTAAKRARGSDEDDNESTDVDAPTAKVSRVSTAGDGVRRSGRNAGRTVSYNEEQVVDSTPSLVSKPSRRVRDVGEEGKEMDVEMEGTAVDVGNRLGQRKYNPKTYGSIPGVAVGTWWATRALCSTDSIHAPFVAGISAGPQGAYSVALSGGYEDDVDLGYAFTYAFVFTLMSSPYCLSGTPVLVAAI